MMLGFLIVLYYKRYRGCGRRIPYVKFRDVSFTIAAVKYHTLKAF